MRTQIFAASPLLIIYFVVNLNQYAIHCETYKQFLARTLPEVCPYSKFCTTGPAKQFKSKKYSPCCKPCYCETDCILTGSCCPDYPAIVNRNVPIQPIAECSNTVHYSYKPVTTTIKSGAFLFELNLYYIIKTCPKNYINAEVVSKCINPDTDRGYVQKHIPVVSGGRGYAFFNQYCAICNGVNTFTLWALQLICLAADYNVNDVNDQQQLLHGNCFIISSPPTESIGRQSRCFVSERGNECNITRKWITPDPNMERVCEATTYQYFEKALGGEIVHKNPYCYKCNNDGSGKISNRCPNAEQDESGKRIYFAGSFTGLLDVSASSSITGKDAKCKPSNVFDYHFDRCRLLHCPATLTAKDGRCVQIFHESSGLSINMLIEVKIAKETPVDDYAYLFANTNPETLLADLEHFTLALLEDIGISKHRCMRCSGKLWQRKDGTGLAILVGFQTNENCTAASIFDSANKWRHGLDKSSDFFVTKDKTRLQFFKQFAYSHNPEKYGETSAYVSRNNGEYKPAILLFVQKYAFCMAKIFLQPMFYCVFVDITSDEHTDLMARNHTDIRMDDFMRVTMVNGVAYRICLNRYLHSQNTSEAISLSQNVRWATLTALFVRITMM